MLSVLLYHEQCSYHLASTNDAQLLDLSSLRLSQSLATGAELAAYWADRVPGKASGEGSGDHVGCTITCTKAYGKGKVWHIFQCIRSSGLRSRSRILWAEVLLASNADLEPPGDVHMKVF